MTRITLGLAAVFFLVGFNTVSAQETAGGPDSAETITVYLDPSQNPNPPAKDTVFMQGNLEILKAMDARYTKPDGFREDQYTECFDDNPKLRLTFGGCPSNRLVSEDGEVIIYASINKPLTKEDSISINRTFKGLITSRNRFYLGRIKGFVRYSEGTDEKWKDLVNYYSPEDTRSIFNADTAISYSFALDEADSYLGKYGNVYSLVFQKHNKGYLNIIVFYTDKGRRTLKKYKKEIEGMFHYMD